MKNLKTFDEFVNESILDKIPFIKDIRAKNRAKKEEQAKKDAEELKEWSDECFEEIKSMYFHIQKEIKSGRKWTDDYKYELQEELNQQVWGLLAPGGEYGDAPKNPKWQWDKWKNTASHAYPVWAMSDILSDLSNITK